MHDDGGASPAVDAPVPNRSRGASTPPESRPRRRTRRAASVNSIVCSAVRRPGCHAKISLVFRSIPTNRRAKLWQALTVDTGSPHLDRQLTATITLMQVSDDKRDFEDRFDRVFGKQPKLPFPIVHMKEITA